MGSPERTSEGIPRGNVMWYAYIGLLVICLVGMADAHIYELAILMFAATGLLIGFQVMRRMCNWVSIIAPQKAAPAAIQIASKLQLAPTILSVFAVIAMIVSAYLFQPTDSPFMTLGWAALAMLIGGAAAVLALRSGERGGSITIPHPEIGVDSFLRGGDYKLLVGIGVLLLLFEAEISGKGLKIPALSLVPPTTQALLFWGGVLLVGIGMAGSFGWKWAINTVRKRNPKLIALLGVSLLAFAVRAWNLAGSVPTSIDDGANWDNVFPYLYDDPQAELITSVGRFQVTQMYGEFESIAVRIFGPTFAGIRAANVPFGVLNVIALYVLVDALFDSNLALIAALVLATFPPHLHFSRLSFVHILDATFGTFAIAFTARGLKYNRRPDWALAGVSLGLTQYWFEAGRLFFPPFIVIWLCALAVLDRKRFRGVVHGVSVLAIAALLIAMPTYYAAIENHTLLNPRLDESGIGLAYWQTLFQSNKPQTILLRIAQPFLVYVSLPETVNYYYGGYHPMVVEFLVPFFLLGLFFLIRWWRTPANVVLLWLLATSGAGLLVKDGGMYPRFIVGYPAVATVMACGIYYVFPLLFSRIRDRQFVRAVTVLTVEAVCVFQLVFYFNVQVPDLLRQIYMTMNTPDVVDATARSANMPPGTELVLISNKLVDENMLKLSLGLFRWNKPQPYVGYHIVSPDKVTSDFLRWLPRDQDLAFFLEPGHPDVEAKIRSAFVVDPPQYSPHPIDPPDRAFTLLYVPASKQNR